MNRGRCQDCRDADSGRGSHCGQCECCDVPLARVPTGTAVSVHYTPVGFTASREVSGEYIGVNDAHETVDLRMRSGRRATIPVSWVTALVVSRCP